MPGSTVGISENYGFPGSYSRNNYPEIRSRFSDPFAPFAIRFSDATFGYATLNATISGGLYRSAQSLSASFKGTSHSSTTLDGLPSTATIFNGSAAQIGMSVIGPGVAPGSSVTAVGASSLTLSIATTTSVTSTFNLTSPWLVSAGFGGIALREVKTASGYVSSTGLGAYAIGAQVDVLTKGSVSVVAPISGIQPFGLVYLQIAVDVSAPQQPVGSYQSAPDGAYTILLPNTQWSEGLIDSNGVAEITILVPNLA
jgi:hypothetical protein